MEKKISRIRRSRKTRGRIARLEVHRLCVYRTPRHTYAQVLAPGGAQVLAAASTTEATVREQLKGTGNCAAAALVGKLIAERAKAAGVATVAFDRSGFKYHGRVKQLAESAREAGLQF
ncbi:MAG: 50S ribosomal protein L18 [Pseudomonadota bacterium]|nr:50S ribosomal protein L18 [Pseudomonadota bacterium]